jgi:DeoR family fructose operon transcriptional repressor
MSTDDRLAQIVAIVNEQGYLSVSDLSKSFQVSEMTIRRDLDRLEKSNRIKRTFGGAAPLNSPNHENGEASNSSKPERLFTSPIDVLITTSVNPVYDGRLLESAKKKRIPIIAESLTIHNEETVVAVDNYQAGLDMGRWAGHYALEHWGGRACALDLTYSLSNTQLRSKGFAAGLHEVLPDSEIVLSLNAQSRYRTAYQLTRDALTVHKNINLIMAINDTIAWGAIQACRDLKIDPDSLVVMPFGLEGNTLKDALMGAEYCKMGLAMFPEVVGPTCLEAAIAAYNHLPLAPNLVTPYILLNRETLPNYYEKVDSEWKIRWETVCKEFHLPIEIFTDNKRPSRNLPHQIGFIIPFSEHEWYKNLILAMQDYSTQLGIEFRVIDAEQNLKDEIEIRRRAIGRCAAEQIQPGDVVLLDGGGIANHLAEALVDRDGITIITNSVDVFDILKASSRNTLILTGGAYRNSSHMLVGPTAEGALRELRADKLFLMVAGVSLSFGLSHTNISEVTMKQMMIRSAKEVILLADHSFFGQESVVQVAPLTVVNKLITDDALPASVRLDLSKLGIQILLANE